MFCGKCGNENPNNMHYCKFCGFRLTNGLKNSNSEPEENVNTNHSSYFQTIRNACEKCGTENIEHAVFCKHCGSKLSINTVNSNSNSSLQIQSRSQVSSKSQMLSESQHNCRLQTHKQKKKPTRISDVEFGDMTEQERYDYLYRKMNHLDSESETQSESQLNSMLKSTPNIYHKDDILPFVDLDSYRFIWTIVIISSVDVILGIVLPNIDINMFTTLTAFLLCGYLMYADYKALKLYGISIKEVWIILGIIISPAFYLFPRASNTIKNYKPAIVMASSYAIGFALAFIRCF